MGTHSKGEFSANINKFYTFFPSFVASLGCANISLTMFSLNMLKQECFTVIKATTIKMITNYAKFSSDNIIVIIFTIIIMI